MAATAKIARFAGESLARRGNWRLECWSSGIMELCLKTQQSNTLSQAFDNCEAPSIFSGTVSDILPRTLGNFRS